MLNAIHSAAKTFACSSSFHLQTVWMESVWNAIGMQIRHSREEASLQNLTFSMEMYIYENMKGPFDSWWVERTNQSQLIHRLFCCDHEVALLRYSPDASVLFAALVTMGKCNCLKQWSDNFPERWKLGWLGFAERRCASVEWQQIESARAHAFRQ